MTKMYFLIKRNMGVDGLPSANVFFNYAGWNVISIDSVHYERLVSSSQKVIELSKDDILGYKLFGEPRAYSKVAADDVEEFEYDNSTESPKVKIEISPERYQLILKVMNQFAILLLEEEFDRRLAKLSLDFSNVETSTWNKQYEEAVKVVDGGTSDLLAALAESKNTTCEDLAEKIISKKSEYDLIVFDNYVTLSKIKTEFKSQTDIQEMNLTLNKYFGITLPYTKEFCDARPEIFDSQGSLLNPKVFGYYF